MLAKNISVEFVVGNLNFTASDKGEHVLSMMKGFKAITSCYRIPGERNGAR
jgi:hypothetical protein